MPPTPMLAWFNLELADAARRLAGKTKGAASPANEVARRNPRRETRPAELCDLPDRAGVLIVFIPAHSMPGAAWNTSAIASPVRHWAHVCFLSSWQNPANGESAVAWLGLERELPRQRFGVRQSSAAFTARGRTRMSALLARNQDAPFAVAAVASPHSTQPERGTLVVPPAERLYASFHGAR